MDSAFADREFGFGYVTAFVFAMDGEEKEIDPLDPLAPQYHAKAVRELLDSEDFHSPITVAPEESPEESE